MERAAMSPKRDVPKKRDADLQRRLPCDVPDNWEAVDKVFLGFEMLSTFDFSTIAYKRQNSKEVKIQISFGRAI